MLELMVGYSERLTDPLSTEVRTETAGWGRPQQTAASTAKQINNNAGSERQKRMSRGRERGESARHHSTKGVLLGTTLFFFRREGSEFSWRGVEWVMVFSRAGNLGWCYCTELVIDTPPAAFFLSFPQANVQECSMQRWGSCIQGNAHVRR
jgi:hypothetical protein